MANNLKSFIKVIANDEAVKSVDENVNIITFFLLLYDHIDDGEFSIESAWYPPVDFFKHLYNMVSSLKYSFSSSGISSHSCKIV